MSFLVETILLKQKDLVVGILVIVEVMFIDKI